MHRREFLAVTATTVSGVMSGCLESSTPSCTNENRWTPTVEVTDVVIPPGDSKVLDIQANGITGFQFVTQLYRCGETDTPVRFGDVETTPEIDSQMDSCPPTWIWDDCSSVSVHAPVHVAADAAPGEYEYGFHVLETIGHQRVHDYEYTINVAEE